MDARQAYEDAARLCEMQAEVFEWQATRPYALPGDNETAGMLRELAGRIRARGSEAGRPPEGPPPEGSPRLRVVAGGRTG